MRLPAIRITVTIGHTERSWYSAGHDAMLRWNNRELAYYREWVRALPSVTCNRVCGHNWSWPLARANGHTIGPMCTICHTTRRRDD